MAAERRQAQAQPQGPQVRHEVPPQWQAAPQYGPVYPAPAPIYMMPAEARRSEPRRGGKAITATAIILGVLAGAGGTYFAMDQFKGNGLNGNTSTSSTETPQPPAGGDAAGAGETIAPSQEVQQFIEAYTHGTDAEKKAAIERTAGALFGSQDSYARTGWEFVPSESDENMITVLLPERPGGGGSRVDLGPLEHNVFYEGYLQQEAMPGITDLAGRTLTPLTIVGTVDGQIDAGLNPWVDARALKVHILIGDLQPGELNAAAMQKAHDLTLAEAGLPPFEDGSQKQAGVVVKTFNISYDNTCIPESEIKPMSQATRAFAAAEGNEQRIEQLAGQYFGTLDSYARTGWQYVPGESNEEMITVILPERPGGGGSRIELGDVADSAFFEGYLQQEAMPGITDLAGRRLTPLTMAGTVEGLGDPISTAVDARSLKVHIMIRPLQLGELNQMALQKAHDLTLAEAGLPPFEDGSQEQPGVLVTILNARNPITC